MSKAKVIICPYCGDTQPASDACRACGGLFEPLSRQATHNQMGPWFIRDEQRPFQPGCSYETLIKLVQRGQVTKYSIIRGPTTRQFWTVARHVPGVAHLLGYCHSCDAQVDPGDHGCHACGVAFGAYLDRNVLGLPEVRPLPWEVDPNDETTRAAGSHRMEWDRPARRVLPLHESSGTEARGGSLSSFATDEELYGHGAFDPRPHRPGGGVLPPNEWTGTEARGGGGIGSGGAALAAVVTASPRSGSTEQARQRVLRLRAKQQKRMIRIIAALLIVLIIILTIVNGSKIAQLLGSE